MGEVAHQGGVNQAEIDIEIGLQVLGRPIVLPPDEMAPPPALEIVVLPPIEA